MGCSLGPPEVSRGWLAAFWERAAREHVPVSGQLDLTYRCGFRCIHCYAGAERDEAPGRTRPEMTTGEVLALLEEAVDAGCLNLLFSGGDPILRPDFPDVYRGARGLGLVVTVFTNGTLVSPRVLEALAGAPPHLVEVSLYGATPSTCEAVTSVPDAFGRCIDGVRRLLAAGLQVGLKAMVLRQTEAEIPAMADLARELGVPFRIDPGVTARLDGDRTPLELRVEPGSAVALEVADAEAVRKLGDYFERVRKAPATDALYRCGAGRVGFHVDPWGELRPCVYSRGIAFDARRLGFVEAWRRAGEAIAALRSDPAAPCTACEARALCGCCPPQVTLETGSFDEPSQFLCELGRLRLAAVRSAARGNGGADAQVR